ncbi:MAG TPA: DMT family transporter [Acidimicrobiales bacterium]|nr:DMT family transporter [Acidimicrobiales bacterium]
MSELLAVGAAVAYGVGVVLQYQAAQAAGAAHAHGRGLLLDLARRPVWLAGIAANGVGFGLRFLALRDGSLVVVQLVVLTGVVFAVPLDAVLARRPIPPREVGLAAVTVAGLVLFLSAAQPAQGRDAGSGGGWLLLALVTAAAALVLVRAGAARARAIRALTLALAGGLLVAFGVALCKQLAGLVPHHLARLVTDWQLYALVVVGAVGVVLVQQAYNVGPLSLALPVLVVVEPVVSVFVGVLLFHEHVRHGAGAILLATAGLVVLAAGAAALARSAAAWHQHHDPRVPVT